MKAKEIAPIAGEEDPARPVRESQNIMIRDTIIGVAGFASGKHIVTQLPEFSHRGKSKILVGIEPRHYADSFSSIQRSICSRWNRT